LREVERHIPEMRKLGVSEVARSPRGFIPAYRRAGGKSSNLSENWRRKRHGFIRRHIVSYKEKPSKRRLLALRAWAYEP
jgi:hypothetical protein